MILIDGPSALERSGVPNPLAAGEERVLHHAPWHAGTYIALSRHSDTHLIRFQDLAR
ncbi:hypothetical protein [Microvirga sp. 2TAF3]|uniref:hypothetical protein n=1 Tax=Microvirga sp. 2TAF3 TaxID=3233014 RepID=UPI003F9B719A